MKLLALRNHWRARKRYSHLTDWALYLYNRLLRRLRHIPLPGRNRVTAIRLRGHPDPFYLRLGATDWLVLEEIFQRREYGLVADHLQNVTRIVDLGANVGFSLRYWNKLFPTATILAVEPDAENCRLCWRNAEAAGFQDNLILVRACVGAHARRVRLNGDEEWAYRMRDAEAETMNSIEVLPLHQLLETYAKGQAIDLMKCDIEGAEAELFNDCRLWIGNINAIAVELHPPYSLSEFFNSLRSVGAKFELAGQLPGKESSVLFLRGDQGVDAANSAPACAAGHIQTA